MGSVRLLILSYGAFAVVATAMNLGGQRVCSYFYRGPYSLPLAMAAGTIIGLVVKYGLDKRWIFRDVDTGFENHSRKFSLYALTGVGTTALFWATEFAFNAMTPDGRFRYEGAALGLGIGYVTKYFMDRHFVFGQRR